MAIWGSLKKKIPLNMTINKKKLDENFEVRCSEQIEQIDKFWLRIFFSKISSFFVFLDVKMRYIMKKSCDYNIHSIIAAKMRGV